LEITLSQFGSTSGPFSDVTLNDSIAVSFSLTEESKIQLTYNLAASNSSNSVELLDSKGNVVLVVPPCEGNICSTVSTVLQPGTYQLDDSVGNTIFSGFFDGFYGPFSADLNASFTPVVPEPRWTIIATLLAALLGGYVMSRQETVKRGKVD
jgi:hypothetical protein